MLRTPKTREAALLACKAHEGQLDKAGFPYILHPFEMAEMMGRDEEAVITALLHDVFEDSPLRLQDYRGRFSPAIFQALELLTRNEGDTYMEYIQKIPQSPLALKVKLGDLINHLLNRDIIPDSLVSRYEKALDYLLSIQDANTDKNL